MLVPMTAPAEAEPLIRPPRLHTGRAGSASRLELFFDLAYVLVVMELAKSFLHDLSWHGLVVFAGLFVAIWVSWVGFTLYANRFDTDDVVFRIAKLAATLGVAGCAASASDAVGSLAVPFAASYLTGRVLLLLLYVRAGRHVGEARRTIGTYVVCISLAATLWALSLAVPGDVRYLLWMLAVIIDGLGPLLATLRDDKLPLHIEHLPERFGLLVILVLGEAVGGIARGVHDAKWAGVPILVGLAGFAVAAAMWWTYFDVAATSSARRLEEPGDGDSEGASDGMEADERHDMFVYGHLPLAMGVVLTGIGLEEIVLHPEEPLTRAAAGLLAGGLAAFLAGIALIIGGTVRTWRSVLPWPVAVVPIIVAVAAFPYPRSWVLVVIFAAISIAVAAVGTLRSRSSDNVSTKTV